MSKHDENIYEMFKKSVDNHNRARRDYELYQDPDKLRKMIKAYYDTIARMGGRKE